VGASFTIIVLSFKVGKARTECDVELPAMYATVGLGLYHTAAEGACTHSC
jgi:hypothetical protein